MHPSTYSSRHPSACLSVCICLHNCQFTCMSICLDSCLSVCSCGHLSINLCISSSRQQYIICLSVQQSIQLSGCVFNCLDNSLGCVCLSICVFNCLDNSLGNCPVCVCLSRQLSVMCLYNCLSDRQLSRLCFCLDKLSVICLAVSLVTFSFARLDASVSVPV